MHEQDNHSHPITCSYARDILELCQCDDYQHLELRPKTYFIPIWAQNSYLVDACSGANLDFLAASLGEGAGGRTWCSRDGAGSS